MELKTIHAISFNLHCIFDDWEIRVDEMARQIAIIQPDVIALQEVCIDGTNNMPHGILVALTRHGYPVAAHRTLFTHMGWGRYEEYLMMVSRQPIQNEESGFLPFSPLQRGQLALEVNGTWYVNTHLEFRKENAAYRKEQVRFLVNKYQGRPHIIMGDFNSEPDSSEQLPFIETGHRAYFPGPSRAGKSPNMAIDGFWVSPELQELLREASTRLLFKEKYLSDHLGVEFKGTGSA